MTREPHRRLAPRADTTTRSPPGTGSSRRCQPWNRSRTRQPHGIRSQRCSAIQRGGQRGAGLGLGHAVVIRAKAEARPAAVRDRAAVMCGELTTAASQPAATLPRSVALGNEAEEHTALDTIGGAHAARALRLHRLSRAALRPPCVPACRRPDPSAAPAANQGRTPFSTAPSLCLTRPVSAGKAGEAQCQALSFRGLRSPA